MTAQKTSIGFKKVWLSRLSADGSIGKEWIPVQDGGREGTGEFLGADPTTTEYKNWLGEILDQSVVAGTIAVNMQLADVNVDTIAYVTGGKVTVTADSKKYTPPSSMNTYIERSVMILTNKNVVLIIPRVAFTNFPAFTDSDLHYYMISGKVMRPYIEEDMFEQHELDAVQAATAKILTFVLEEQTGAATIDHTAKTIAIEVETGTSKTALTPIITASLGASVTPYSGVATDFTNPVLYSVEAADGTTVAYTVTVTVAV